MRPPIVTDFDEWLVETFAEAGAFTMLFVLLDVGEGSVALCRSAYLHVVGDETRWPNMLALLESATAPWSAAVFFRAGREGLVADAEAKTRLAALVRKLHEDRMLIKDGEFFNRDGLRLAIEEMRRH